MSDGCASPYRPSLLFLYPPSPHTHTDLDPPKLRDPSSPSSPPLSIISLSSPPTNMAAKSDGAAVSPRSQIAADSPSRPGRRASQSLWDEPRYSAADCCWTLGALLVFFSDGASDLWLAADYYLRREYWCFALTLVFVIIPSVVVQVLSFRWFAYDFSETPESGAAAAAAAAVAAASSSAVDGNDLNAKDGGGERGGERGAGRSATGGRARGCCRLFVWLFQALVHILQLAQVWRYVRALYLGAQSRWRREPERRHFRLRVMFESADICVLRLLESFLKSAPQLVLQLSIMIVSGEVLPLQGLSASASLMSLAWMLASYQKVLRDSRDDKLPMSYKAAGVHMLWHLFTIGARALAFALFASVFQLYFGIFVVAHWCAMTFWIIRGETDFCVSKWEEIVYNMMVGVVYVFCWFSVREGRTRRRLLAYSLTVCAENAALTAAWYLHRGRRPSDLRAVAAVCAVAGSYALGTFFMAVYYCLLHPDGPVAGRGRAAAKRPAPDGAPAPSGPPPPDALSGPPGTLQRTKDRERDADVFQVRAPRGPRAPVRRPTPGTEGPVIRIDLPRKSYPAWDAHYIDRRLRKTILLLESAAPVAPRIQYRCLAAPKEVAEYETTV
ncbi:XK-related protein 7-like [Hippocampus zosterae]|uniref:XK-related protein 7-like n=1 Tax=Hippocampus zosterae TaxID=109293 RepID=UPI00223CB48A|nr:XK-related protein 7-like [Hippocampus zosterae]